MRAPRRFDDRLMSPPEPGDGVNAALLAKVKAWCEVGAFPELADTLRVVSIAPHPGLDGVARELDGSHALSRLSRWRGLAWRLQLLWRECALQRASRPEDPWDGGWWRPGALGAAETFQPRRPTLLLVRASDHAEADALVAALRARRASYEQAVRVLLVTATPFAGVDHL